MRRITLLARIAAGAGLCVLGCKKRAPLPEETLRETFRLTQASRYGAKEALGVASSNDIRYESGFSAISNDPPGDIRHHAFRWMSERGTVRLRVHPGKTMRLAIVGWTNNETLHSKPVASAYLDGRFINSCPAEEGGFGVRAQITPDLTEGKEWVTLEVRLSSVAFHWVEAPKLKVAVLTSLDWTEDGK